MKTLLAHAMGPDESQSAAREKRELLARLLAPLPEPVRQPATERLDILRAEIHRLDGSVGAENRPEGGARFQVGRIWLVAGALGVGGESAPRPA